MGYGFTDKVFLAAAILVVPPTLVGTWKLGIWVVGASRQRMWLRISMVVAFAIIATLYMMMEPFSGFLVLALIYTFGPILTLLLSLVTSIAFFVSWRQQGGILSLAVFVCAMMSLVTILFFIGSTGKFFFEFSLM